MAKLQPPPSRRRSTLQTLATGEGCARGCLVILAIVLAPYLIHAGIVLTGSVYHQIVWHFYGSQNYKATIDVYEFSPRAGENTITVWSGQIISGTSTFYDQCQGCPSAAQYFDELRLDQIFGRVYGCALLFPVLTCSISYDAELGYPVQTDIDCQVATDCSTRLTISKLELLAP